MKLKHIRAALFNQLPLIVASAFYTASMFFWPTVTANQIFWTVVAWLVVLMWVAIRYQELIGEDLRVERAIQNAKDQQLMDDVAYVKEAASKSKWACDLDQLIDRNANS